MTGTWEKAARVALRAGLRELAPSSPAGELSFFVHFQCLQLHFLPPQEGALSKL